MEIALADFPSPSRPARRRALGLACAIGWLVVAAVELITVPNESLLVFVVPPVELASWLAAAVLTVVTISGFPGSAAVRVVTAVVLLGATIEFNNWSVFEPRSYYLSHRWAFAAVADGVRHGTIGASDAYYGEFLPWPLRDLSTDGRASVVGGRDGVPVVFLPQYIGIPDDAAGYAFYAGPPADLSVDLYGAPASLGAAQKLGDGWWYVRPGDVTADR